MNGFISVHNVDSYLQLVSEEHVTAAMVNKYCFEKQFILNRLNVKNKSLETRFLEITGKQSG